MKISRVFSLVARWLAVRVTEAAERPNAVPIMSDARVFSDLDCYGDGIATPQLVAPAATSIRRVPSPCGSCGG